MQKSSKNDYLSIDYFLDDSLIDRVAKALHIRNRIGKIVKNLEDISGTSQMKIPVTYPSGSKYLYSIFSSEDVYAVLREDWEGVIFQILLPQECLKKMLALPREEEDFFAYKVEWQEFMSEIEAKAQKYIKFAKENGLNYSGIGTAIIPDAVREKLPE